MDISQVDQDKCFICGRANPHDHHLLPVEYSGDEAGQTIPVCPTCHDLIHREGESMVTNKKRGLQINETSYPDINERKRAMVLANYIAQQKILHMESGNVKADGARNAHQIRFTNEELAVAHDLKRQMGMRSLERMIKALIFAEWQQRKNGKKNAKHKR